MIRLLAAELYRMWSRRLLRVLGALVMVAMVVGAAITFVQSNRDIGALRRQAEVERRRTIQSCVRGEFDQPGQNSNGGNRQRRCERIIGEYEVPDPRFQYVDLQPILLGTSPLLAILCLLLGASFVGAEWQKGTITTALTWEPRRVRLLATKFAAIALVGAAFVVLMHLVLAAVMGVVAVLAGGTEGVNATWARETAAFSMRVAAVGGLTAVVGCAIATVGRNTTAALGAAFVYFAVLEGLIRGFRPKWQPWLLGDNATQFISGQAAGGAMADKTTVEVALTLLLYAAVFMTLAAVFFNRRDVT
ncbi:MAG: ABC transporter permease [Actinomycetota bacterium]|nr:ABC transporter permease [Actinomycetota bacterium]